MWRFRGETASHQLGAYGVIVLFEPSQNVTGRIVSRLHRQAGRWHTIIWVLTGAICLAQAHTTIAQQVYKVTDADGNVTFTDTPPLSSDATVEEHSVHAPNTAKPTETTRAPAAPVEAEEPIRYDTQIVTPADNATIPMGPGNFSVQVSLSPRLEAGEHLLLLMDGEPVSTPQRTPNWQLSNVYRGEHRLQVLRINNEGAELDASDISTVFVMRPIVSQ